MDSHRYGRWTCSAWLDRVQRGLLSNRAFGHANTGTNYQQYSSPTESAGRPGHYVGMVNLACLDPLDRDCSSGEFARAGRGCITRCLKWWHNRLPEKTRTTITMALPVGSPGGGNH